MSQEDIVQVCRVTTSLCVEVRTPGCQTATLKDDQPCLSQFVNIHRELVGIPAILIVAAVCIDTAQHAGIHSSLQFVFECMSGTPREVFSHAARLAEIGLSVPQVTALFLRLRELGVDVDPTTFTVEQAVPQLRALLEGRAHA